jgi:hypothetical protein
MAKLHTSQRIALTLVTLTSVFAFAAVATADTIYMKTGRVIKSAQTRVEGDRVYFTQYGGEVSVPLDLVDRIVEDQATEPPALPPAPMPVQTEADAGTEETTPAAEGDEVPSDQTQEFWQDRVRSIEAERTQVNLQIEDLKRTERAFLFSHRSTSETRQSIEEAEARLKELDQEYSDLQAEARRLSIPAGWLRLPPGERGGGGTSGGASGGGPAL